MQINQIYICLGGPQLKMTLNIWEPNIKNCGLETGKYVVRSILDIVVAILNMQIHQILIISWNTQPEIDVKKLDS